MNSDQLLVFIIGVALVFFASLEFWHPQLKAVV